METQIKKWGNSLGIRIPINMAKQAEIKNGSLVDIVFDKGKIIIKSAVKKKYELEDLLSKIDDSQNNIHREIDTGESTGNEIW